MLKFILLGIGFMILFEGLFYFFFTKKMKTMIKLINELDQEKIKSLAIIMCVLGTCLIYFTFKIYKFD